MNYNEKKYWVEKSELLTEREKTLLAKDLRELELRGVIEWRDDGWRLAAGAKIEETPDGLHSNSDEKEGEGCN